MGDERPYTPWPPAGEVAGALSGRDIRPALAAGFGLTVPLMTAYGTLGPVGGAVGLLGGVLVGAVFVGRRWAAFGGFASGVLAWTVADGGLVARAPSEWGALASTYTWMGVVAALVIVGAGLGLGGRVSSAAKEDGMLAAVLGAIGLLSLAGFAVTFGVLAYAPAPSSFEIALPVGWHVVPRSEIDWSENIAFGDDYTAVYGTTDVPTGFDVPVIGVTVVRGSAAAIQEYPGYEPEYAIDAAEGCYRRMDTWARPPTPLYDGDLLSSTTVTLPVGPAYYEVREATEGSSVHVHGYGIARTRLVGMLVEHVCYIVAVSVPPGAGVSEEDARAIVESFAFR
jgi:hypothetical protein